MWLDRRNISCHLRCSSPCANTTTTILDHWHHKATQLSRTVRTPYLGQSRCHQTYTIFFGGTNKQTNKQNQFSNVARQARSGRIPFGMSGQGSSVFFTNDQHIFFVWLSFVRRRRRCQIRKYYHRLLFLWKLGSSIYYFVIVV